MQKYLRFRSMHTAADVTFVTHAIARALTDSELQAPALDNFPQLTRYDSKTIMFS